MSALQTPAGATAQWIFEQVMGNQLTAESGAVAFGPDTAKWLAWWYQAVQVIEHQRAMENNERMRQDELEARNGR